MNQQTLPEGPFGELVASFVWSAQNHPARTKARMKNMTDELQRVVDFLRRARPEDIDEELGSHIYSLLARARMLAAALEWVCYADPVTGDMPAPPKRVEVKRERSSYRQQAGTLVYAAYALDGSVLYVGVTDNLFSRMAQHQQQSRWWDTMERLAWEEWPDRTTALRQEALLIRLHKPPFNTVHNPDKRRPM